MRRRICTICARGGSKGVPNKNLRDMCGKPLIAHTIERARETAIFDLIAVSSDSQEILDVSSGWGADLLVRRPDELANDEAPKIPVIHHCLTAAENAKAQIFDTLVDLDATSPLRSAADIIGAVKLLESSMVSSVITGAVSHRSPYFNLVEVDKSGFVRLSKRLETPVTRRQDAPKCFDMNASVYVWNRNVFVASPSVFYEDTLLLEMPVERSHDIDSELDFEWVEYLMSRRGRA